VNWQEIDRLITRQYGDFAGWVKCGGDLRAEVVEILIIQPSPLEERNPMQG